MGREISPLSVVSREVRWWAAAVSSAFGGVADRDRHGEVCVLTGGPEQRVDLYKRSKESVSQ